MRKSALPSSFALAQGINLRAKAMKTLFFALLFLSAHVANAAISVVRADATNICSNLAVGQPTPGFTTLGTMTISEGPNAGGRNDFGSGTNRITLTAPAGWQFATGVPFPTFGWQAQPASPTFPATDVTNVSLFSISSSVITVEITTSGTSNNDQITISGIRVQALSSGSLGGAITANPILGTVAGMASTNMGNLALNPATTPAVTIAASPSSAVCSGVAVTFTPTPSNAVSPTYNWFLNGISQGISPTFSYVPTNGDNVQAVMTSNGACETNSTPSSNVVNMTVYTRPSTTAGVTSSPVCENGSITLNATTSPTGTAPFNYSWAGPGGYVGAGQNAVRPVTPLSGAGSYSVTVSDVNGCTSTTPATVNVTVNANPVVTASAAPNPICEEQTLNLTAGITSGSPTSFQWNGPNGYSATGPTPTVLSVTSLAQGVYTLIATDANTCVGRANTASVVVRSLPTLSANAVPLDICEGNALTLTSTPGGGTGGYASFSWTGPGGYVSSSEDPAPFNVTLANTGSYNVTVTDGAGCTSHVATTLPVTVHANPAIIASGSPNPACVGNTLSLSSTPSGGTLPYSFVWSGPSGFASNVEDPTRGPLTVAHAGTYSVTVTDFWGCVARANTGNIPVNTNPNITTAVATPLSICEGATLTLQSVASGGGGGYSFSWSGPGAFTSATQNTTNPNITLAGAGVYSVVVTDVNGCFSTPGTTGNVVVHANPSISANATPNPICEGNTLNLTSTPSGGSGTYVSYAWNGPSFTASTRNATNPNITLAGLGVYFVTVTDNFGCTATNNTGAVVVFARPTVAAASATPNPICVGSTLNLNMTPAGGSGTYSTFAWSGPAAYTAATQSATRTNITTGHAGVYTVTVTDDNGCTSLQGVTSAVVVNTLPTITANASPNPICAGNTLALTSTPAGGNGSYVTYSWTGPNSFASAGQNPSIPAITTAATGTYSVLVTDGNGCTSATPGTVAVTVNSLPTATVGSSLVPPCVGSTLNLTATPAGGSGTYSTFSWTGPNSFVSASQNPSISSVTTAAQGTYSFTVSDNNGCTSLVATTFVTVNTNPTIGSATATPNPICVGQTLGLNAAGAGGSGSYVSYAWTGPNGYTAATQVATRPAMTTADAGAYSVTVTDNNGCVSAPGATSAVVVNTLPTITANATPNPLCIGATLALSSTPTGGSSGSYVSYSWAGPNGFTAATQNPSIPSVVSASAGVYSVNVTDGNGCTSAAPGTTAPVVIWSLPTVAVGATPNPLCESATLSLSATPGGGSGTYTVYSWNGPNGFTSASQNPTVAPVTLAGAGTYSVTVTDNNGCTSLPGTSPLVIVNANPSVTPNATPNPVCQNGAVLFTATASGGGAFYTSYAWNGPSFTSTSIFPFALLTPATLANSGVYTVTVTDNNGCQGSGTTTLVVNPNPTITATATPNPICAGNTLSLNSTPAGGSGVYSTFAWTGPSGYTAGTQNATRPSIAAGGAGVYNVTVTDNNGCSGSAATSAVVVNPNPIITANATPNPICEGNTLTLTGGASGGTTPYATYTWTGPNSFSSTVTGTTTTVPAITTAGAGVYSVTVSDANGCTGSGVTPAVVVNTNPVIATAAATPNPICSGATLGLTSTATGGSGTYTTYSWAGPGGFTATGQNPSYVGIPTSGSGVYSVNVTDNNGCTSATGTTAPVVVNPSPTIVVTTNSPVCEGNNTLNLNSTPSGGSGTYVSFVWSGPLSFSASTQNTSISPVTPANSGVYNVTVTDNNGCFGSGLSTVTINALPLVFNVTGGGSYCSGGAGVPIGLDGSETDISYTLYFGSTIAGSASGTGSAITFGNFTAAGATYTVSATNTLTGCTRAMSGNTSVTILPLPVQYNVTGGGDYCLNGTGVAVGLAMSDVGFTYQLYRGATAVGTPVGGTGAAISFGLQTIVGTYTVLATNDFTSCQNVMNGSAVINTLPLPADHLVAGGGVDCQSGPGFHVGMTGSDFGINYQLYNGATAVGSPVPGNGGGIDFGIFNTAGTYSVLATNTVTGCQAVMSGQADFIVHPNPTVFNISGGGGYCIGGPGATIGLTGSESGVDYQLYNGSSPVGLPVTGTGSPITFGPQFAAGTYSISATNTTTFCMSDMGGGTVVVPNAPPTVYAVSGGGNYCDGGTGVPVMLSGSDAGVSYTVTDGSTTVLTGTGSGAAPFTIGNVTAAGTFSVVATNLVTTCTSNMTGDVTVAIDPLPLDQTFTGGGTRCAADPGLSIGLASSEAGVAYELFLGGVSQGAPIAGPGAIFFGTFTTAGTYTVQATNTGTGCSTVLSGSATIIVNPTPSAITGASSVCEGSTISLSDVDAPGVWNVDNATLATINPTTGDLTGIAAGTVNVTYTLNTGCFISTPITVNATPSIGGATNVCVGSSVTLTGTPGGGTWSNPTASVATIDIITGVITGVSAGADEVTYTLGTGCYMTRTQTVDALPVLPAITATATSVCEGGTVTYFNALGGGTWSSSSPANATVNTFSGVVGGILAGSANIVYGYTDITTGCSNTTSLGVTVNPAPGISIITGDNTICSAATTTLSNASGGGVWSSDNNSVATVNSATGLVTGVAPGSVNISYTVTNVFGCSASTSHAMIIGNLLPASAILPVGGATICDSNAVNLSVVTSGTLTFYQWMLNGLDILGANSSTYTTMTPGFYQVMIGDGSCMQTLTAGTTVVAGPAPVILFDTLNNILYTGSFNTYQWFYNGVVIPGATGSIITPMGDGLYAVVVADVNNCSDTATFQMGHPVNVNSTSANKNVRIYPNPATTTLFIDAPGRVFVTVLSADGKMLIERQEAVSINVSQLADGMYMIMVHDENGALIKADKFMKMQ